MWRRPTVSPSITTSGRRTLALNAIVQPEQFIEMSEEWRRRRALAGDKVQVRSMRGKIKAVAVVTKRIRPLPVAGQA